MNNRENLPIYQKYIELIYYTNDLVRKFPKSEKFVLTQEIKQDLYKGLRCLLFALKIYDRNGKLKYLNELDININLVKIHIRLAYRYEYITLQNYTTINKKMFEICNMLGGWINSCLKK